MQRLASRGSSSRCCCSSRCSSISSSSSSLSRPPAAASGTRRRTSQHVVARRRGGVPPPARATASSGAGDNDNVNDDENDDQQQQQPQPDIDQLAAFLSARALEMRQSLDEGDVLLPCDDDEDGGDSQGAAGAVGPVVPPLTTAGGGSRGESPATAAAAAAAAGPSSAAPMMSTTDAIDALYEEQEAGGGGGGFIAQDFAILKLLGRLGVADPSASGASTPRRRGSRAASAAASMDEGDAGGGQPQPQPQQQQGGLLLPPAPPPRSGPLVLVYAARYQSGLPYQGPVTVQLREFARDSRRTGVNELLAQRRLCGAPPADKWRAAAADPSPDPPVVRLLGHLEAPPSDEAYELTGDEADTLWLVYRFEGLRPLSLLLDTLDVPEERAPQRGGGGPLASLLRIGGGGGGGSKESAVAAAIDARRRLLKAVAAGLLGALSFCHRRGVAHCGVGGGSVVLSSWQGDEAAAAQRMLVKLDSLGLARRYDAALEGPDGAPAPLGADDDAALQRTQDLQAAGLLLVELFAVGAAAAGAEVADAGALKRLLFDVFGAGDVARGFRGYCLQDEQSYGGLVELMDLDGGAGWELVGHLLRGDRGAGELLATSRFFSTQ